MIVRAERGRHQVRQGPTRKFKACWLASDRPDSQCILKIRFAIGDWSWGLYPSADHKEGKAHDILDRRPMLTPAPFRLAHRPPSYDEVTSCGLYVEKVVPMREQVENIRVNLMDVSCEPHRQETRLRWSSIRI